MVPPGGCLERSGGGWGGKWVLGAGEEAEEGWFCGSAPRFPSRPWGRLTVTLPVQAPLLSPSP